jgi:predicted alpha/beta superfamily hydrolase
MEDRQDSKSRRARKRARNLVAKQSKYKGFVHKPAKVFRRKEKYPVDFES